MPQIRCASSAKNFICRSGKDGKPVIYFAGNSLGLMPKAARAIVEQELDNWAKLGGRCASRRRDALVFVSRNACASRRRDSLARNPTK